MKINIIPGINNSNENHWQSYWERKYGFERISQDDWHYPKYDDWEKNLVEKIKSDGDTDTILVAHSLGCLLVAKVIPKLRKYIKAVFFVAPPDPKGKAFPEFVDSFNELPENNLGVPGLLVYSENDEYASTPFYIEKGKQWGLDTISIGRKGHINSESNIDDWAEGYDLFQKLLSNIGFGE